MGMLIEKKKEKKMFVIREASIEWWISRVHHKCNVTGVSWMILQHTMTVRLYVGAHDAQGEELNAKLFS